MEFQTKMCISVVVVVVSMICVSGVQAGLDTETYNFINITNNNAADASAGEGQISVMVSDHGAGQVSFKFLNEGPADCVITEIYFQDGSILDFASINESLAEVDFKEDEVGDVSPKNLPGGKSIDPAFIATTAFSIEPVNPEPTWGVNPGEWVEIVYTLKPGKTYDHIIQELNDQTLRIGIHVQGFESGGSESFITPEPATMMLLGLGTVLLRRKY